MGSQSRGICRGLQRSLARRRFYSVYWDKRGYFVLLNLLTRRKKFYSREQDVKNLLDKPLDPLGE